MKVETHVKAGQCKGIPRGTVDMWAGPIWSDAEAPAKCPGVCSAGGGKWNKQWMTPPETWGENSVCGCDFPTAC
jgi:hypothetical protein